MSETAPPEGQTAPAVLMVRPARFGYNAETAASNFFQHAAEQPNDEAARALREFDALAGSLSDAGIRVLEFAGQADAALPDEVFPNNWLSLHADGTAVLYPLCARNRRRERRDDVLAALRARHGYRIERVVNLTHFEIHGEYLEGTGSVVLDRQGRVAYACLSPRTHAAPLAKFAAVLGYEAVTFHAADRSGRPIYHTNVLLAIGTRFAALCTSAIADEEQRRRVVERLTGSGRDLVDLGFDQLDAFAGNMLELRGTRGPVIALSAAALRSLGAIERRTLERHGELVTADVATIERIGGGSVRCMLAEVSLPRAG